MSGSGRLSLRSRLLVLLIAVTAAFLLIMGGVTTLVLTRRLTGRWLLYPPLTPNLLWEPLLRRIYEAAPGDDGPYYFFICRKPPAD